MTIQDAPRGNPTHEPGSGQSSTALPAAGRSQPSARLVSVDALRGLVMLLMVAEICLQLHAVAEALPESRLWSFLGHHQTHVPWSGASLHDLIHPCFTFLVGVAVPYSLAKRLSRGQSVPQAIGHAVWRALILVVLGIFLRSIGEEHTVFTFMDTLTLIGLGYVPLFFIGLASVRPILSETIRREGSAPFLSRSLPWVALAVVLVAHWGAFALYPLPGPDFDYPSLGVPADWPHHESGFAAHWNKNSNLGWEFDRWFLNLFPRTEPFEFHPGGYSTLNFIPVLGTMLLGLIAGRWLLESASPWAAMKRFLLTGVACLLIALALDGTGICPIVKRLWTPSWVLLSGGWSLLLLAAFYVVIDIWRWQAWCFPLRVLGMNSLAAYCLAELFPPFVLNSLRTHLGQDAFKALGEAYEPALGGLAVLIVFWLFFYWMYRRKIFVKI